MAWDEAYSSITSLDVKLAKRILRDWQRIKIEDTSSGGLSGDNPKRMK
jgi:hypothetical protein